MNEIDASIQKLLIRNQNRDAADDAPAAAESHDPYVLTMLRRRHNSQEKDTRLKWYYLKEINHPLQRIDSQPDSHSKTNKNIQQK